MDLVAAEIFSSILVFTVLIGCSFIPFTLISCRRKESSATKNHSPSRAKWSDNVPLLSLCNCFAAGVFLATCFLGLVPHVREHVIRYEQLQFPKATSSFNETSADSDVSDHKMHKTMPWTEVLLIGGFLLILLIEELIHVCQDYDCTLKRKTLKKPNGKLSNHEKSCSKQRHLEDQPLITAGECPDDIEAAEKLHMHDISPERRHAHAHDHHNPSAILADGHSLNWRSVALLMGLGIHGAFEGVALGLQESAEALFSLLFGVMTHEVLCAVAFGINLAGHKIRFSIGFLTVVLFSLSIPLGMVGGIIVHRHQTNSASSILVRIVLEGLAAGTFVYVAFIDMLNNELATNKCRLAKVLCVCFGFLLFFGLTFFT